MDAAGTARERVELSYHAPVLPARVIEPIESLRSTELAEIETRWRHPHVPIGTRDDAEG
jgi:hypothetical protein